ncbi:unnamed protein product, partial [Mesorhabditis belari]|uniref:Uncharacterized protein n=1 Tax=Mesorhabditis belari TaxID=2138241 RepID=A0AAF3EEU6_9BILA
MADFLEFDSVEDADRMIDSCSFQSSQFDIFTHDYREYSDQLEKNVEGPSGCGCGEEKAECCEKKIEKKVLVNVTRLLQKAQKSLLKIKAKLGDELNISEDLIAEILDVQRQLGAFVRSEKSEFASTTLDLPDFDVDDMELLLGEALPQQSMMDILRKARSSDADKVAELLNKADILLIESDHIIETVSGYTF